MKRQQLEDVILEACTEQIEQAIRIYAGVDSLTETQSDYAQDLAGRAVAKLKPLICDNTLSKAETRWFFHHAYVVAGRPMLEDKLMTYARHEYLECLVYDSDLPQIVKELQYKQELRWSQNKRLKKVEIRLSPGGDRGRTRVLQIGAQHLVLYKVKAEISYV